MPTMFGTSFIRDSLIVQIQTLLRRLVVIRRDKKQSVRAVFGTQHREIDGRLRAVRAGTGNDRYTVSYMLDAELHGVHVLFLCHGCRFTG